MEEEEQPQAPIKQAHVKPDFRRKIVADEEERPKPQVYNRQESEEKSQKSESEEEPPVRQPQRVEPPRVFGQESRVQSTYVDHETKELQVERVKYLREFLALEYEKFDNLLEILPSSYFFIFK